MGRYYSGDIKGKFWVGVQSSDAADRFGVEGTEPNYLYYYYDTENLPTVVEEIENITTTIGEDNLVRLDTFFTIVNGYNDAIVEKHDMTDIMDTYLSDYADLHLGRKIRDCIVENGSCSFEAEL